MVKKFDKAELDDVLTYKSWLVENRPVGVALAESDTESRLFNEHEEDLICLRKNSLGTQSKSSKAKSAPASMPASRRTSVAMKEVGGPVRPQVATIGLAILLLIPFMTFHVIPSSIGRLFIVLVVSLAQGAMVASTPVGAYMSENEWMICAAS